MAALTPSYTIVNPSYIAPEMIIGQQQASGAFETIASGIQQTFTTRRVHTVQQAVAQLLEDALTHAESLRFWQSNIPPTCCRQVVMIVNPTAAEKVSWSGNHARFHCHAWQLVTVA